MLCRVADSLFWLGRYLERAENTARLVEVYLQMTLELEDLAPGHLELHWSPILRSTGDLDLYERVYDDFTSTSVPDFLTLSLKNPSSILSCVNAARENARMIRDQLPGELWEVVNRLYLELKDQDIQRIWADDPTSFYTRVREMVALFQGLSDAIYPHQDEHAFLLLGKFLERGDKTARILDVKYHILLPRGKEDIGGGLDTAQWIALLRACSAWEAYFMRFVSQILPANVVELLILSPTFPRSLRFCVDRVGRILHRISGNPPNQPGCPSEEKAWKLRQLFSESDSEKIILEGLHEFLDDVTEVLEAIGADLARERMFFPVVDPVKPLGENELSQ